MTKLEEVKRICNIGTGTISPGIILSFASAGYQVQIYGRSNQSIKRCLANTETILASLAQNHLIQGAEIPGILGRIKGVTTLEEAAENADFVIEAIVEDLSAKQEIFRRMEKLCPPETIFASSTSGLSPSLIAEKLTYKNRFIVAHFWNPPHLIPLVEVVSGKHTSQATVDITSLLLERIGKKPVVLKREALGFIGNRLQFAMLREALFLIESGIAGKEAVDATIKYALGRRLSITGPFESADLTGLDTISNIAGYLFRDLCSSMVVSPLLREMAEHGKLGAKTGSGFYEWTPEALEKINKLRENNLLEWAEKDKKAFAENG